MRSTKVRVDTEFYQWLKEIAEQNHCSLVTASKMVTKDHKELQFYLKEQKIKGERIFSLRI